MPATLKEIAARTGYSLETVSQCLKPNGAKRHLYRDETLERIRATARELGYRPNAAAKAMARGRFGAAALVLSTTETWSILPHGLLAGIQDALHRHDLSLLVTSLPDEKLTSEGYVPRVLRELMADGLLINYNANIPRRMVELIDRHTIPSVWINSKQAHDCVYPDDYQAGRVVAQRLVGLGHRNVVFADFVSPTDDRPRHYSQTDRFEGYANVMREAGLGVRRVGDRSALGAGRIVDVLMGVLREAQRPTAFVCYGPDEASAAFMAGRMLGMSVPGELSIACFRESVHEVLGMRFATMVLPEAAVGQEAVGMLRSKIKLPARVQPCVAVPFTFDEGRSLAASPV